MLEVRRHAGVDRTVGHRHGELVALALVVERSRERTSVRAAVDLVSLAVFAFFFGMVTWYAWGVVWQSSTSNSHSLSEIETPLGILQGLWFAGLLFFVLVALLLMGRAIMALLAGDLPGLFALIGSNSAVDEAQEEVLNVEHAFAQEKKE